MGAEVTGFATDIPTEPLIVRVGPGLGEVCRASKAMSATRSWLGPVASEPDVGSTWRPSSLVRRSSTDSQLPFETNVMCTVNPLDTMRGHDCLRVVINVTNDSATRTASGKGYREDDPLGGQDPYSGSKACAEIVGAVFRRSFFAEAGVIDLRPAALGTCSTAATGGRIGWCPTFARTASSGRELRVRNRRAIRPWQHVLNPLGGICC